MELSKNQTDNVIRLIKFHIEEKGNCRVGWAPRENAGVEFEKSIHNIEKIANKIIESGRYLKEDSKQCIGDVNIRKNPDFKLRKFNKQTVVINILISVINLGILIYSLLNNSSD